MALLQRWFKDNQRALPFRESADPYRIWISEIMLQQTRVAAMLPRYNAFIDRFPDVKCLAAAEVDEVLSAWQGLGYYSRARNLHKAARLIVIDWNGLFPRDPQGALALPGIGPYTAAAVLSIAYGVALPVVDGNVQRVLARLFAQPKPNTNRLAAELLEARGDGSPGLHNQAMMELGALVCLPKSPDCQSCPLLQACAGRAQYGPAVADFLPAPKKRQPPILIEWRLVVSADPAGRILLTRASDSYFLRNTWFFPQQVKRAGDQNDVLYQTPGFSKSFFQHTSDPRTAPVRIRHTITHHKIEIVGWRASVHESAGAKLPEFRWVSPTEARALVASSAARKLETLLS